MTNKRTTAPLATALLLNLMRLEVELRRMVRPPQKIGVAEFAEKHHRLLSEAGAGEPGQYHLDRTPYLHAIMAAFTDPRWWKLVIMKPSQVGLTTLMGIFFQYIVEIDPKPILWAFPASDDASAHSKAVIQPVIDSHPQLSALVSDVKAKSSDNTILHKAFPGGYLKLIGLNSPRGARRITVPYVFADDVDGIETAQTDKEGSRMRLLENRSIRRSDRKHVHGSTPTIAGGSIIEDEYAQSNQGHLYVPCPHCKHWQMLVFGPRSQFSQPTRGRIIGDLAHGYLKFDHDNCTWACYICEKCGKEIDESEKPEMLRIACQRLDAEFYYGYKFANATPQPGVIGFHFNEIYSLLPGSSWVSIANQFLAAKRAHDLQPFVNTKLAETYSGVEKESVSAEWLRDRQEKYFDRNDPNRKLPKEILGIIVTADPQIDYIEAQLTGFGEGEETWELEVFRFQGSPEYDDVWNDLQALINTEYDHELGIKMSACAAMVDMGYKQERTIDFVRRFEQYRRVYAIKGDKGKSPLVGRMRETANSRSPYLPIGRTRSYRLLYTRLRTGKAGEGKIHFNQNVPNDYFIQLANANVYQKWERGDPVEIWEAKEKNDREEAIDNWRYALALVYHLNPQYAEIKKNIALQAEATEKAKHLPAQEQKIKIAADYTPPKKDVL
jgi:phage terminase large subunit GpA-like protein